MQQSIIDIFFALLRYSLEDVSSRGEARDLPITEPLSDDDWKRIFAISKKQALIGVIYSAVQRLPQDLQPPKELMDKWNLLVRQIIIRNTRMNATATKLTQMFEEKGRKTVILKGQANALLYPEPLLRQAGDIDILVEGGRKSVIALLQEMDLLEGIDCADLLNVHVHLKNKAFDGVVVEAHYEATYNKSPFSTKRMLKYLNDELINTNFVSEGFNVPSYTFALIMQLSHLQKHFYDEGVGLRQLVDYYLLICRCSDEDLCRVRKNLYKTGLFHIAGAVMWVMNKLFYLPESLLLCAPDGRRGYQLLKNVIEGGNFGKFSSDYRKSFCGHWFYKRFYGIIERLRFDFSECLWGEFYYYIRFMISIPYRIKYRKISLRF